MSNYSLSTSDYVHAKHLIFNSQGSQVGVSETTKRRILRKGLALNAYKVQLKGIKDIGFNY